MTAPLTKYDVSRELARIAIRLQRALSEYVRTTPRKVAFREEYAKAIEVLPPRFETTGSSVMKVQIRPMGSGTNKAEIAERGFGGNGPGDSLPQVGKEGPYRMNELLLKNHPEGITVKFDLSEKGLNARLQEISQRGRLAGGATTPEARQQKVAELRRQIFGGAGKSDPHAYKTGEGHLQPTSWTARQGPDGVVRYHRDQNVHIIGRNVIRLGTQGISAMVPTLGGPHRPMHKANKIEGLMRVDVTAKPRAGKQARIEAISYIAFRRLTQNSNPWIHPGIKGLHLMKEYRKLPAVVAIEQEISMLIQQYNARGRR